MPKIVGLSGDIVIVVDAVIGVGDPELAEVEVGPELNKLRLTLP